jgi:Flp pilus assembly protein protease CpaA
MSLISEIMSSIKKINDFSIAVVLSGIFLALGLILIGYIMNYMEAGCQNTLNAIANANGAFQAAPLIIVVSFITAIISDLAVKDKENKE